MERKRVVVHVSPYSKKGVIDMRILRISLAKNKWKYGFNMALVLTSCLFRSVVQAEGCACSSGTITLKVCNAGGVGNKCTPVGVPKLPNGVLSKTGWMSGGPQCGIDEGGETCGFSTARPCP